MTEIPIGKVTHYWPKAGAASLDLTREIHVGDRIRIRGRDHEFEQDVTSLEVDHEKRAEVRPGESAAVAVRERVHENDEVFRVTAEEPHWSVASGGY